MADQQRRRVNIPGPAHAPGVDPRGGSDESAVRLMHLQAQVAGLNDEEAERARRFRTGRRPWWRSWSWLLLTVVAAAGFLLACVGGKGSVSNRLEDALALFPSGFPSASSRSGRTTTFIVAMYLAPIVALWVTGSVVVALYARHWNEFRARRRRGHAIVSGKGQTDTSSPTRLQGCQVDYVRMIEGATPGCRHHAVTMPAAPSKMALVQAAEALERIRAGGVAARAAGVGCAPSLTRLKCTTARVVVGELTRVSAS
jgi:hypothetical protein